MDLKPGRELDALIAEKVMGIPKAEIEDWNNCYKREKRGCFHWAYEDHLKKYSTSIAAAWEAVEKMQSNDWGMILDNLKDFLGNFDCHFDRDRSHFSASSESAPHAICLAALKAVE